MKTLNQLLPWSVFERRSQSGNTIKRSPCLACLGMNTSNELQWSSQLPGEAKPVSIKRRSKKKNHVNPNARSGKWSDRSISPLRVCVSRSEARNIVCRFQIRMHFQPRHTHATIAITTFPSDLWRPDRSPHTLTSVVHVEHGGEAIYHVWGA